MDSDDLETERLNDAINKVVRSDTGGVEFYMCSYCGSKSFSIAVDHKEECRYE